MFDWLSKKNNAPLNKPASLPTGVILQCSPAGSTYTYASPAPTTYTLQQVSPTLLSLFNKHNGEIVRLNCDGTVSWSNGIDIDAAASALGSALTLSAENQAGITDRVRRDIRNDVYTDLINVATKKGPISAEELTYLLESSKMYEKLKGNNNDIR